jgi:hypothetical protein
MLTARRAILGLALLLAMIGDSSGQSPPEPPRQNPGGAQQQPNTEERDTDQAPPPSIIKKAPAEDTQQKPNDREQNAQENRSNAWTLSDEIAVVASIAGMLQFVALIVTVCVLMRTAKRQLRAYVFISHAEISDIMSDQRLTAKIVVKNFGQTPAYKVIGSLGVDAAPFPLTIKLPRAVRRITNINIGPGGEITMNFGDDEPVLVEWQPRFTQKTAAVYVYGTIEYRDAFRIKRFTDFRIYKGGDGGVSGPLLNFSIDDNKAN